jgi:hypothetical protein
MADEPKRQKGHRIWLAGRDSATQVYESHWLSLWGRNAHQDALLRYLSKSLPRPSRSSIQRQFRAHFQRTHFTLKPLHL